MAGYSISRMVKIFPVPRYLTNISSIRMPHLLTDVLVIGSGIAGLRAAIEAAQHGQVLLISKGPSTESNTWYAQGGIAAAIQPDDVEHHIADTRRVGCGLCDEQAVELLVRQGAQRVRELAQWGTRFDLENGTIALGKEGGHSARRILHAKGDAIGQEIISVLLSRLREHPNVRIFTECTVIDLITRDGQCYGAVTYHAKYGHQLFWAGCTILATGGCGQLYRETTNPAIATGDGHAMAYRAGAVMRDMEMVQFHPTTLYVAGATRTLISETVRGEGAHLVNNKGERFMEELHPDAELAPRDVVSRAIQREIAASGQTCVYLDARHIPTEQFRERFPYIAERCADFDLDTGKDLIPVRPSAHYMVGGVQTDLQARSSVTGLLACGEAASSGAHGANRLASNSLLEGLVFGTIAGQLAADVNHEVRPFKLENAIKPSVLTELDLADIRNSLRSVMWRNVGIERDGRRLAETLDVLRFWSHYTLGKVLEDIAGWEVQNMLIVSALVAASAAERSGSLGVHFRSDADTNIPQEPLPHTTIQRTT